GSGGAAAGGAGEGAGVAGRGAGGGTRGTPVGRAKRRRTAAGEPGASTGNRAKAVAGGRADGGPGREDGGGGVWADPEAAWGASINQRAGDAQHGVCAAMRAGPAVAGWGTSYRSGCCA